MAKYAAEYNGFTGEECNRSYKWMMRTKFPYPTRCVACGQCEGLFESHAEDYRPPFGTREHGLCLLCHRTLHYRFDRPERWAEYLGMLRDGAIFQPIPRGPHRFWAGNRVKYKPLADLFASSGPARTELVFDQWELAPDPLTTPAWLVAGLAEWRALQPYTVELRDGVLVEIPRQGAIAG